MTDRASDWQSLSPVQRRELLKQLLRKQRRRVRVASFGQEQLWVVDQMGAGAAYNLVSLYLFRGDLLVSVLARSLDAICERHETLRTTFTSDEGTLRQVIRPASPRPLPIIDLSSLPRRRRVEAVEDIASLQARTPFDLTRGPLLRTMLLRLGGGRDRPAEHVLLVSLHHIITDGTSQRLFYGELIEHYRALRRGRVARLPSLPIQYADFAKWQREWATSPDYENQLAYWKSQLGGEQGKSSLPVVELPTDRPRSAIQTFRGASERLALPGLAEAARSFSQRQNATPFMTLLAAFAALLGRYSGQNDITVGSPIANRNRIELEPLIGFFVNSLVMRTDLSRRPTFRQLVARVRRNALDAYAHQDIPFEHLVEELQPERDLSRNPLFQVMFALRSVPGTEPALPDVEVSRFDSGTVTCRFDLELQMVELDGALTADFAYNTDLFDATTIGRFAREFRGLLSKLLAEPDVCIDDLEVLGRTERHQLIAEWNDTARRVDEGCLHRLFADRAERSRHAIAVTHGDSHLSYGELERRANVLAGELHVLGVAPDDRVGLCIERGVDMVVGVLAILQAGGAYVPLDPALPADRLELMLADSGCSVLVTARSLVGESPAVARLSREARVVYLDAGARQRPALRPLAVNPDHLAYVIYTSGSTGRPKGVEVAHRGAARLLGWVAEELDFDAEDVLLAITTLSFDIAMVDLFLPLLNGAKLIIAPRAVASDAARLERLLTEARASVMQATPATWGLLVEAGWPGRRELTVISTGEALPLALADSLRPRARRLWNLYGPTEATVWATGTWVSAPEPIMPIGRSIGNMQTHVLDARLRPVPRGIVGELYLGGTGLARGYHRRTRLTAELFLPNPFGTGERMYRTGDLVRLDAGGRLLYLGRADHQMKLRGFRIEPGEIESWLERHQAVERAVVLLQGETVAERRLVAYLQAPGEASAVELRDLLSEALPDYMVPSAFVSLPALPLSASGKIDRRALARAVASGEIQAMELTAAADTVAVPRGPIEEAVAGAFAEVLDRRQIDIDSSFFEIGGHSLLATQLLSRIRDSFRLELPLSTVFAHPTVRGLAARVEQARRGRAASRVLPIVPVAREGGVPRRPGPLSAAQRRLWFLDQLGAGAAYNIRFAVELEGELEADVLEASLRRIVERHEVLRATFPATGGKPRQAVSRRVGLPFAIVDLTALGQTRSRRALDQLTGALERRPFDLAHGPVMRTVLARLGQCRHVLVVVVHHIAFDAWSIAIFRRELAAHYQAATGHRPSPAELEIQYLDYAAWQQERLSGPVLEQDLAYWKQQLGAGGASSRRRTGGHRLPVVQLPADRPRPPVQKHRGDVWLFRSSLETRDQLSALSRRQGVTMAMLLLAVFKALLARITGQRDLIVGSPIAQRLRSEVENLIGFFINSIALRTDFSGSDGGPAFTECLRRVQQVTLAAYDHQEIPFDLLVDEIEPERDLGRNPIFQIAFVYQQLGTQTVELPGLRLRPYAFRTRVARMDLELFLSDDPDGLTGRLVYNTDLFDATTIGRIARQLQSLLAGVLADPGAGVSELPLLGRAERHQLTVEWSTGVARARDAVGARLPRAGRTFGEAGLHDLIATWTEVTPDRVAVIFDRRAGDGAIQLTYRELDARANRVAAALRALGVGADDRVALCLERGADTIIALLGIWKAGGAYVPLDPDYPRQRLDFMLRDSRARVLVTRESLLASLPEHGAQVLCLDRDREQLAAAAGTPEVTAASNLAYVIYTSGSTGRPKGVMVSHRGLCNLAAAQVEAFGVEADSRVLQFASLSFDASASEMAMALASGAAIVLADRPSLVPGPELIALMRRCAITTVTLPPTALAALPDDRLPVLDTIASAGEACSADLVQRWGRSRRFLNAYGPTEVTVCATIETCNPGDRRPPSIGRPMAGTRAYVLDRRLRPVAAGVAGELQVAGVGVGRGYCNQPKLTAERFVPDPLAGEPGARMYRTGDLARARADGVLEFLGRGDHQVKVRGYRIESGEVEAALRSVAGVREAVVVAEDIELGRAGGAAAGGGAEIELWPSVAEFFVYDDLLYYAMTHDQRRNDCYRAALDALVRDKVVLDIGTGADAILTRLCLEAGARKVYAIELLEASYLSARKVIQRLGVEDRVQVIHGDATRVELPEPVDVCVSEIVGAIGGSEGAAAIINDAWRFMKDDGVMVPDRSTTQIAAVALPDAFLEAPAFSPTGQHYVDKVFDQVGYRFDLRLCLKNATRACLASSIGVFEDLDFTAPVELESQHPIMLRIHRDARISGFLVWLKLQTMPGYEIDILDHEHCWLPVLLPVFQPALPVARGDVIRAEVTRTLCDNGLNPDYRIVGTLERAEGDDVAFDYTSHHFRRVFRDTPFYARLFDSQRRPAAGIGPAPAGRELVAYLVTAPGTVPANRRLRRALKDRLPEFMVPSRFVPVPEIPLTPNGKVDRGALRALAAEPAVADERPDGEAFVAPRGEVEAQIATIWAELLGVEQVGADNSFFDLGGNSLLLVQVQARLRQELGGELSMTDLFQFPTVAAIAARLRGDVAPAPLRSVARDRASRPGTSSAGKVPARHRPAVAVIAMAGQFPGAADVEALWSNVAAGVESIRRLTDEELRAAGVPEATLRDPSFVGAGGKLDDVDLFDARLFGVTPREAELIDPQQRVFLECAWQALERAGYDPQRFDGLIGVYAGASSNGYLDNLRSNPELFGGSGMQAILSNARDYLPTRVSYKLNLRGPSLNIQTACSTSLVAVHTACRALLDRQCDMALAGGVSVSVAPTRGYHYREGDIGSPDGHCRPFDARAQGTVRGDGSGIVVLKRLDDALADGDCVHAVILGTAINNDGSDKIGFTAPGIDGQAEVIAMAQAAAGVDPESITYVEAHGTATPLGDPVEVAALSRVFREHTDRTGFCGLSALKSNVGHLDATAGVAGLIKTVLALEHQTLPPSLHFESPNPEIDFDDSPFYVVDERRDWRVDDGTPRRAGVSSFGLGGTNAHAVLEEAPEPAASDPSHGWQLLTLSAQVPEALDDLATNLAEHLRAHPASNPADVAYTLQVGRRQLEHRRVVRCREVEDAVAALAGDGPRRVSDGRAIAGARSVAFMFPGQGAQDVGMGAELYASPGVYRDAVDACLAIVDGELGLGLRSVLIPESTDDPETLAELRARLERTSLAQPALFTVSYALARQWMAWGVEPDAMIGHSIGELVAACLAGVWSLEDALRLAVARGHLMESMPPGAMTAVPLAAGQVEEWLGEPEADGLELSAINAPSMCVVSGTSEGISAFERRLAEAGTECRRLRTSHAFHSASMDGAIEPFVARVREVELGVTEIPYVSCVSGDWITAAEARDPEYWGRQIRKPVCFAEGMERILSDPGRVLLEVGPGTALRGLSKLQESSAEGRVAVSSLGRAGSGEAADEALAGALGRLWAGGVEIDWSRIHGDARRRRVTLPTYPFQRQRYWIEQRRDEIAPSTASQRPGRRRDPAEWFYTPVWRRAAASGGVAGTGRGRAKNVMVIGCDSALGRRVASGLERSGCRVIRVEAGSSFDHVDRRWSIDRSSAADYARLVRELERARHLPTEVVHLWGVSFDHRRPSDAGTAEIRERGLDSLIYLVKALDEARISTPVRIDVVTDGVHQVLGDEPICPEKAMVLGACRVIPLEFPGVSCRHIDLAADDEAHAERLVLETLEPDDEPTVAYRRGRRWTQTLAPIRLAEVNEAQPARLRRHGVYLITGGLGGMGLEVGLALARELEARLVLTGRTGLPEREQWPRYRAGEARDDRIPRAIRAIEAMEAAGGEVFYAQADVCGLEAMLAAVTAAEQRFGAIHGVFHLASDLAPGIIQRIGPADIERELAPKVTGARVLERILARRDLDFLFLASSLATWFSTPGRVAYCAANAYLDAFAGRFASDTGTYAVAVDWTTWKETGMAFRDARARGLELRAGISSAEGIEVLRRVLDGCDESQILVSEVDPRDLGKPAPTDGGTIVGPPQDVVASSAHARPELSTDFIAPRTGAERQLTAIWENLLGIGGLGVEDNYYELGGDSVLAIRIVAAAREAGLAFSVADLLEHQTVAALVAAVLVAESSTTVALDTSESTRLRQSTERFGWSEQDLAGVMDDIERLRE